ncbi:DUF6520 family protein [Flavivirga jejuensis]|uniref:DUF6520 family protein n=1 Tax=Flavivirga jejuensis TaxID=870487 RepID=A0ABT8WQ13_9FLAO|nr:DUF6520 family protein [Flavivirga jejuensis]MDO5975259.1 DUF6520 family protein [Flavivirga jejuensis]
MKTKLFKIILPAFAFILAITASFAFTSSKEDIESQQYATSGYIQTNLFGSPECHPVFLFPDEYCTTNFAPFLCTIYYFGQQEQVYQHRLDITTCIVPMWRYLE